MQEKIRKLYWIQFDFPSFLLIPVWNEVIDFSDFFIMFSCRDSVCSTLPPPQFIPFPLELPMSWSHWILLFTHIWWWTCTTKKVQREATNTLKRSTEFASSFKQICWYLFVILWYWLQKKGGKVSECLYRINGCAHNRTTNPIKTIKNRFYRESLLPTASINWYSYKVPRTNDLVKTIRLNWSCLDETTRLEMWCILGWV